MNEKLLLGLALSLLITSVLGMILAGYALVSIATLRRQVREIRQDYQRQNTSMLALHGAMKMISEDVISHGQVQSSVSRTLERLSDQQTELRLRDVDDGFYPQAIQLIQDGRGREEVRKICGLTESELDLLFSLHGQGLGFGSSSAGSTRR